MPVKLKTVAGTKETHLLQNFSNFYAFIIYAFNAEFKLTNELLDLNSRKIRTSLHVKNISSNLKKNNNKKHSKT